MTGLCVARVASLLPSAGEPMSAAVRRAGDPAGVKCRGGSLFLWVTSQRGAWKGSAAAAVPLPAGDPASLPWQSVNT